MFFYVAFILFGWPIIKLNHPTLHFRVYNTYLSSPFLEMGKEIIL